MTKMMRVTNPSTNQRAQNQTDMCSAKKITNHNDKDYENEQPTNKPKGTEPDCHPKMPTTTMTKMIIRI